MTPFQVQVETPIGYFAKNHLFLLLSRYRRPLQKRRRPSPVPWNSPDRPSTSPKSRTRKVNSDSWPKTKDRVCFHISVSAFSLECPNYAPGTVPLHLSFRQGFKSASFYLNICKKNKVTRKEILKVTDVKKTLVLLK